MDGGTRAQALCDAFKVRRNIIRRTQKSAFFGAADRTAGVYYKNIQDAVSLRFGSIN
jgi:hypothetical protein